MNLACRGAALIVFLCVGTGAGVAGSPAPSDLLLPDLVQEAPADIRLTRERGRDLLGFRSAVYNAGRGPLIIEGRRPNRTVRDMRADQLVLRSDGSSERRRGVGIVRYVSSPDHSHWHFLPFERYELYRGNSNVRVTRDRKSGFCLGDRYEVSPAVLGAVTNPRYLSRCQLNRPGRLSLVEGISVGWGDDYAAYLEGQYLDVTGLASGRYRLTHTVDASSRLSEVTRTNNVASVMIRLSRGATGRLRVAVVPR